MFPQQWNQAPAAAPAPVEQDEEADNAHRPPNAFILYSQAIRSQVRQENPSLSNTEASRLLGKMWKDVPSDIKLQYKQKAAAAQEIFKREHPDYTYRKARRKRALNELLTKSAQGFALPGGFPTDPAQMAMFQGGAFMIPGMYGQPGVAQPVSAQGIPGPGQGQVPQAIAGQRLQGYAGYPGLGDPTQGLPNALYQFQPK
jgi:transcription factor SOX7/8/10/18 (SOX group E/F)